MSRQVLVLFVPILLGAVGCHQSANLNGNDASADAGEVDSGGAGGSSGTDDAGGTDNGDAAVAGGGMDGGADAGSITLVDGGVVIGDGGMPTNCTIGPAGPLAVVPVETMAPGTACGGCHLVIGKPIFISGTVFPAYHEADLCLGVTDVKVELVDSFGATHTLNVNSSGNFIQNALQLWPSPWKVAVVRGAERRPMAGSVTNGDCNSCHTAAGASGAPGRIVAPDPAPTH